MGRHNTTRARVDETVVLLLGNSVHITDTNHLNGKETSVLEKNNSRIPENYEMSAFCHFYVIYPLIWGLEETKQNACICEISLKI